MKTISIFTGILMFQSLFFFCYSQELSVSDPVLKSGHPIPYDLSVKEWNKVQKIWRNRNLPAKIFLSNNSTVYGQILFRNDSLLALWADTLSFFNPYEAKSMIRVYDRDSISKIVVHKYFDNDLIKSGLFWGTLAGIVQGIIMGKLLDIWPDALIITLPIGIAIGGTGDWIRMWNGNSKTTRVPVELDTVPNRDKNKYCFFPDQVPGSIRDNISGSALQQGDTIRMTFENMLEDAPYPRRVFYLPKLSISLQYGRSYPAFEATNKINTYGGSVGYKLWNRFSFGYSFRHYENSWYDIDVGGIGRYNMLDKNSHMLFLKYSIVAMDRLLINRFEIAAGIGASLNPITFESTRYEMSIGNLPGIVMNENKGGIGILADLDFYFSRHFSVYMGMEKSFIGKLHISETTIVSPASGKSYYFESEEINPSSFDLSFGIRVHF